MELARVKQLSRFMASKKWQAKRDERLEARAGRQAID
jgi:hypothetical protein